MSPISLFCGPVTLRAVVVVPLRVEVSGFDQLDRLRTNGLQNALAVPIYSWMRLTAAVVIGPGSLLLHERDVTGSDLFLRRFCRSDRRN